MTEIHRVAVRLRARVFQVNYALFNFLLEGRKMYKLPCSDQILVELTYAGGETLVCVIHILINSIWDKEELPDQC
jgi:hypothetical protein